MIGEKHENKEMEQTMEEEVSKKWMDIHYYLLMYSNMVLSSVGVILGSKRDLCISSLPLFSLSHFLSPFPLTQTLKHSNTQTSQTQNSLINTT